MTYYRRCWIALISLIVGASLWAEVNEATLARLANRFATDDSLARVVAFDEFEKAVVPADRAAVLAAVWAREKNKQIPYIQLSVMAYLTGERNVLWTAPLGDKVMAARRDPHVDMRRLALRVTAKREPAKLGLFLEDTNDALREDAVIEIGRRPEGKTILNDYARKYARDKKRVKSVGKANFFLKKTSK